MLKFKCARCQQKIGVPDTYEGKRVRCPNCSRVLAVPRIESENGPSTYSVKVAAGSRSGGSEARVESARTGMPRRHRKRRGFASEWVDYLQASKPAVFSAFMIIGIGTVWLLSEQELLPPLQKLWTMGLAITGVLILLIGGINKQTMVVGPFLVICAGFSLLRQTGNISLRIEIPSLVIAFGFWLLIVVLAGYSLPDLVAED